MARKINRLNARAVATLAKTAATLMAVASISRFRQMGAGGGCSCIAGMASPQKSGWVRRAP